MKRQFVLFPITFTILTPMSGIVGCTSSPITPLPDITINLISSVGGSVKNSSLSVPQGSIYVSEIKETLDSQVEATDSFTFTRWFNESHKPITKIHVFIDGETVAAHFVQTQDVFDYRTDASNMTARIIGFSSGSESTTGIVIPTKITDWDGRIYTVTSILDNAFENRSQLTGVEIPSTVTQIGFYSFQNCTGLEKLTINFGVIRVGISAFEGCTSLTKVEIPDSAKYISTSAFCNCTGLENLTIGSSVEQIDYSAFGGCTKLESIIFNGTSEQYKNIKRGKN